MSKLVPVVPSSSGESGNTITDSPSRKKQISPCKRWCFTLNNYTSEHIDVFKFHSSKYKKCIIGEEIGESGTPHLQGFIKFTTKLRPLSLFKELGCHWEKARGTDNENLKYCSKDNKVCFSCGFPTPRKPLACENNFRPWQVPLNNMAEVDPDDRTIVWIRGVNGNEGKTTYCKYLHRAYGAICLGGKSADMKNGIIQYIAENGDPPSFIVVNLPRSFNSDYLSYTGLEEVKDMFFYSGKYEGGMVDGNPPHLWIFSNELPDISMCSSDRWLIYDITDDGLTRIYTEEC